MESQGERSGEDAEQEAKEALDAAEELSNLLDTGLDREALSVISALCETGVRPEALAAVVKELRREAARIRVCFDITVLLPSFQRVSNIRGELATPFHLLRMSKTKGQRALRKEEG